ncbi:sugar phosphate isomerase/epimerase family protein [Gordonia lacunae]|uniref:Xylose isomerase n=1 Tax=Gordonia lacunae TaxID=417102 RepID=A0A243QAV3_9ACTN|nr:sugar phosphate isomerase/epimerase [Gordonia lacunae]OUC78869.1 xylose isomerase [Gordonia lacunae]
MRHPRLGCSTITFRRLDLDRALDTIAELGFREVDLGSLPNVCEHVPLDLDDRARSRVVRAVGNSGLEVRSINADIGDLNRPATRAELDAARMHVDSLLALATQVGAVAVVLPNGALSHDPIETLNSDLDRVAGRLIEAAGSASTHGVELWTESLHVHRLCCTAERALALTARLDGSTVRHVVDVSHVVASGADLAETIDAFGRRTAHVHLRDATPGDINLSIGRGVVDFERGLAALQRNDFDGHLTLELETHDVDDADRPSATAAAADTIESLLDPHPATPLNVVSQQGDPS